VKLNARAPLTERPVWITPGLSCQPRITVTAEDFDPGGGGYDVTLGLSFSGGRYVCDRLTLARRPGGPPVTGEAVRAVPVARLLRWGVRHLLMEVVERGPDGSLIAEPLGDMPADLAERGPTEISLRWVARVYTMAVACGDPPTAAVEKTLRLPRSTAGRWVSAARDRGYLGPTTPGKIGGTESTPHGEH
jgi:hypothetical protein